PPERRMPVTLDRDDPSEAAARFSLSLEVRHRYRALASRCFSRFGCTASGKPRYPGRWNFHHQGGHPAGIMPMKQQHICPKGHQWEASAGEPALACPHCAATLALVPAASSPPPPAVSDATVDLPP